MKKEFVGSHVKKRSLTKWKGLTKFSLGVICSVGLVFSGMGDVSANVSEVTPVTKYKAVEDNDVTKEVFSIQQYKGKYSANLLNEKVTNEFPILISATRNNRYVPYNYLTDTEKQDLNALTYHVANHYTNLLNLGVNISTIEPVNILLDVSSDPIKSGGKYTYVSVDNHTTNPNNYIKNTILVTKPSANNTREQRNLLLNLRFVHEFGHHVGFSKMHFNQNFTDYLSLFDNVTYEADKPYVMQYQDISTTSKVEWRNKLHEQFAESYTELFFADYPNTSAVPNLTEKQRELFTNWLITSFSKTTK